MNANRINSLAAIAAVVVLGLSGAVAVSPPVYADAGHSHEAAAATQKDEDTSHQPMASMMAMPMMNPQRGMVLFAEKGCVACHSINGVGGHDATPLDAHEMSGMMNPFEFSAKMWQMAPAMIAAQEEALGEQILFTGDELADIIAFVHNDEQQHMFTEAILTPRIRQMMDHQHGGEKTGTDAHAEEIGHEH
jgi:cytochrome c